MSGRTSNKRPEFALRFEETALAEWRKLDQPIRAQFKKKLQKLILGEEAPSPRNRISGLPSNYYKIKQRSSGYRLVYQYNDAELVVLVVAVGKRNRNLVYRAAIARVSGRGR